MNTEMIEQQVQATLENKTADVRDAVRQVTLKALSGGELDTAALRRVMDAVVKGAQRGAASRGEQGRQALSDAMKGLDEALAVAAEATRLALQEAAGRTSEFSRHEIERALDDLKGLESLFIETLSDAARSATGFAEATLRDLAGHARSSGTAVGHQVTAALAQLGDAIAGTAETQLETGTQTLRASGALLASMASGMLAGIAGQQRLMLWQALTTERALGRLHDIASILICYGFGNIVRRMGLAATLCLVALPAAAAPTWLIATADETAQAGAPIVLDVVKPAAQADWPGSVRLKLMRDGKTLEIPLAPVEPVSAEDTRRAYRGALPAHLSGLVRVDLAGVESNRLALLVSTPDAIEQMQSPVEGATKPGGSGGILFPVNEPALSVNEPMYFVIGSRSTARFQLSFKYRLFDPDSLPVEWFAPLAGLHFGYTQTSLWDLGADSAPFYDTSYRPSLFWQGATSGKGLMPDQLRAGYEHESNGKDGADTRSIDTLFAQPVWRTEFPDGRALIFAPKVYAYLDKSDNPDIQRYRGYANWNFRYGREDGWLLATQLRTGTTGHGSAQLDLSWPLRRPLFARTGGFLHIQLFKGYGESLLDYNLDRGTQVRVGFSIVR